MNEPRGKRKARQGKDRRRSWGGSGWKGGTTWIGLAFLGVCFWGLCSEGRALAEIPEGEEKKTGERPPEERRGIVSFEGVRLRPKTQKKPQEGEEEGEKIARPIRRIEIFRLGGGWEREEIGRERMKERRGAEWGELVEEMGAIGWLRMSPGVEAPVMRGGMGARLAIRLGDIPLLGALDSAGGLVHLKTLDMGLFSSLGLVRGPASVIYGDRALTGALHLSLPEPVWTEGETSFGGRLFGGYRGMDQGLGGTGQIEVGTKNFSLQAGGAGRWDGEYRPAGEGAAVLGGSGYPRGAATLRVDGRLGDRWEVRSLYLFGQATEALRTDRRRGVDDLETITAQRHLASVDLRSRLSFWKTQIRGLFGFQWLEETHDKSRYLPGGSAPIGQQKIRYPQQQWSGLLVGRSSPWSRLDVQYGLELIYTDLQASSQGSEGHRKEIPPLGLQASRQTSAAFFLFGRVALLQGTTEVDIEGGFRMHPTLQQFAPETPLAPFEWNLWQYASFVGVRLGLQEYGQIKMFYSEGFRLPDPLALAGRGLLLDRYQVPADPHTPERTRSLEASLAVSFWPPMTLSFRLYLQALDGWLSPASTLYQGQRSFEGRPVVLLRPMTVSANLLGLELSVQLRLGGSLFFRGDATWQDTLQTLDERPLPMWPVSPAFQMRLWLRYQFGAWGGIEMGVSAWTESRVTSAYAGLVEAIPSQGTVFPGGALLAVRGDLAFSVFRLVLALENLLDTPASPAGSFLPSPARHIRLGLEASW